MNRSFVLANVMPHNFVVSSSLWLTLSHTLYLLLLPMFLSIQPATPQEAQNGPHKVMAQALMKRSIADIPIVTHIQKESTGMNKLYSQSMCSVKQWRAYQAAEAMVQAEVEEVRAEADAIEPGWSQVCICLFRTSQDLVRFSVLLSFQCPCLFVILSFFILVIQLDWVCIGCTDNLFIRITLTPTRTRTQPHTHT